MQPSERMRLFATSSANEVSVSVPASVLGHFDPEIISSKNDAPFEEINLLNYFPAL